MSITLSQLNGYLETIFGTFGRSVPTSKVQQVIHRQVGHLPERFFEWACVAIGEKEDKLPANIGRYLGQELWQEFRTKNPQLMARESHSCPDCEGRHDERGAGFYCFKHEDDGWHRYFSPCRCASAPHGLRFNYMPKVQAEQAGYKLVPRDWKGSLLKYELWLIHGVVPQKQDLDGRYAEALRRIEDGKAASMEPEPRRFRHLPEREQAEATAWITTF